MLIFQLASRMAEALIAPRRSARRLLDAAPSQLDVLAIAALSIVLFMALVRVMELSAGVSVLQRVLDIRLAQLNAFADMSPDQEVADGLREAIEAAQADRPLLNVPLSLMAAVTQLLNGAFGLFAAALFAWGAGRIASGRGEFEKLVAVTAWYSLVSVVPSLVFVALLLGGSQASISFMVMVFLYLLYIYCSFIAEAHGFKSTFSVLAPAAGLGLVLVALLAQVSSIA